MEIRREPVKLSFQISQKVYILADVRLAFQYVELLTHFPCHVVCLLGCRLQPRKNAQKKENQHRTYTCTFTLQLDLHGNSHYIQSLTSRIGSSSSAVVTSSPVFGTSSSSRAPDDSSGAAGCSVTSPNTSSGPATMPASTTIRGDVRYCSGNADQSQPGIRRNTAKKCLQG